MMMSEKCKKHVDSCRFCWMCHHICPIGNATGLERNTAKGRALGISLVNRGSLVLSDIMDNIYECACCGACVQDCTTGWDPVMFTKETSNRSTGQQQSTNRKRSGLVSTTLSHQLPLSP